MGKVKNLKEYLEEKRNKIEKTLQRFFPKAGRFGQRVFEASFYSLMAGGKRIRPILCLAAYELYKENSDDILLFASGIECIHTYSLIHDDLPCMDNDDFRRGKPSCHKAFDEATAILAGDGLQALAFEWFTHPNLTKKIDPLLILRATSCIANAIGLKGMVGGQMADLLAEGKKGTAKELRWIHEHKTVALIRASLLSGAILADAPSSDLKILSEYGKHLGMLFQMVDDLLDLLGDEKTLGKPLQSDLKKKKLTYPALYGTEKTKILAKKTAEKAINLLIPFGERANVLKMLTDYLLNRVN
ncbi:MAG: polyprenyl synthetase family protein [Caldimicrobium sp.]